MHGEVYFIGSTGNIPVSLTQKDPYLPNAHSLLVFPNLFSFRDVNACEDLRPSEEGWRMWLDASLLNNTCPTCGKSKPWKWWNRLLSQKYTDESGVDIRDFGSFVTILTYEKEESTL